MKKHMELVSLNIHLNPVYTALVTGFAEQFAKAAGLEHSDALRLTLACEEIFTYLCRIGKEEKPVTLEAQNGIYFVQIKIIFDVADFDPRAFNITASVSLEDENSFDEMGLLIASRLVDSFGIIHNEKERISLFLVKEKRYPEISRMAPDEEAKPLKGYSIITPDSQALKDFARKTVCFYSHNPYPSDINFPGKLVDMCAYGDYEALVAADNSGEVGGGIIWRRWYIMKQKVVECAGPYIFGQPPESGMAEKLMDAFIGSISKTEAICLINSYATPEMPLHYFEKLGVIDYYMPDGTKRPWQIYFRFLKEDTGSRVWAHPELEDFLNAQYDSLSFARHIIRTNYAGESRPPHSVFASRFVHDRKDVILNPVWDGIDVSENLAQHVKVLKGEGASSILLYIDLGYEWQANLVPALQENNFIPRLVMPYAGKADIVIFQHGGCA